MTVTLWNGWSSFARSSTHTFAQTLAIAWTTSEDRACTGARYYRPTGATSTEMPNRVRVWRNSDGHVMADLSISPGTGAAGWLDFSWASPWTAVAGVQYRIAFDTVGGGSYNFPSPDTTVPAPLAPLALAAAGKYGAEPPGFPDITFSAYAGVDVVLEGDPLTGGSGTGGTGGGATTGDLASWFSSTSAVNSHQSDGLPWRTDANVTTLKSEAEGVNGFAAIKAVADAVAAAVSGLPGTIAGAVTTITGQLTALVGTVTDTSAVTVGRIIHDLAAVTINTQNSLVELARMSEGAGTFPSDVGTLVWTMLDETDFVGSIAWAQPADVYVLSITTRPIGLPLNLTDGVHTIYRCGWWCPLNGSFARQRSYIDFEDNHLTIGAERMPGVLVSLQPGGEGHIQAWALT